MPLDIRHVSLGQLLSRPIPFQMARYQRHYEWGRKEMDQLLEDFGEAFALHQADPEAGAYHFLGNVILFLNPSGQFEVVDGQQRLTSLSAFIAAARDLESDPAVRTSYRALLSIPDLREGPLGRLPRLKLHRGDNDFMRDHIVPDGRTDALESLGKQSHPGADCLRTNALLARAWLRQMASEEREAFVRFVLDQGRFVEIQVGTEDDAFRIFETVNSRGRPISSEDVLRYALVEYATDDADKREEFLSRWDVMESELGPRGMKRFIAGWRARVTKGARVQQALHRTLLNSFDSPAEARAFLDSELSTDLSIFRQIHTADVVLPDGPAKKRIDTLLRSLALVDFDEWLPVASELIARADNHPERLAADLARIERLAWYFYLNRDDKGIYQDRRERFSSLMRIAATAGTFAAMPPRSLLTPEQCNKMRDCVTERLDPKWVPLRSLMVRMEMALVGDSTTVVRDDLTVEHILPLHPKAKAWLALYDDLPAVIAANAEQIGNLCLVTADLNTKLGNQIYANKRRLLIQHRVPDQSPLAADIATELVWSRNVIERRSNRLIQVFCDTFDIQIHP